MAPTKVDIPLLIHGNDVRVSDGARTFTSRLDDTCQGASKEDALRAVDSCAEAFKSWSHTSVFHRRELIQKMSTLLQERDAEFRKVMAEEIACGEVWLDINMGVTFGMLEEAAAQATAESMRGSILPIRDPEAQALVYQEPLGVILGIAPWNAPLILGMRAVLTAVAVGNTAILKGSELSPRSHYMIAELFRDAGFPPGVVNFIIHRAEDAPEVFDVLINAEPIRKCNFTGSTPVGRVIAQKAGAALKPVLLELGGKNCSVVLGDADIEAAAKAVLQGATLNNGQICMSTDIVAVTKDAAPAFKKALKAAFDQDDTSFALINKKGVQKVDGLVQDAKKHGAEVWQQSQSSSGGKGLVSISTVVLGLTPEMRFFEEESFGPMLGVVEVETADQAVDVVNRSGYGLSCSVWTKDQRKAIAISRRLNSGAVHVNSTTVHDEATLPHGGRGLSGFGRFGGTWGLREFVQTKTIILHP